MHKCSHGIHVLFAIQSEMVFPQNHVLVREVLWPCMFPVSASLPPSHSSPVALTLSVCCSVGCISEVGRPQAFYPNSIVD